MSRTETLLRSASSTCSWRWSVVRSSARPTGILIERYTLSPEAAFAALARVSSERNRKLYDIAEQLVAEGHSEGL